MDLSLGEQQRHLRDVARDFVRREASRDKLVDLDRRGVTFDQGLWRQIAALGWLGIVLPEEYGGEGASLLDAAVLFEELGRGPAPGPFFDSSVLSAQIILAAGSAEQQRSILPDIARGERIVILAAMDATPRWGSRHVRTQAVRMGDGYELSGVKPFVLYAATADTFIVAARTEDGAGAAGITLFLVDRELPGLKVRDLDGRPLEGLVSGMGELTLDRVAVPESAVLGRMSEGWRSIEQAAQRSVPVLCAYQVGGMEALAEMAIAYSQTRVVFGQAIGRFQRVQDRIIDIANHRDAARWANYEAIWKLETGREAAASVHMAKAVASEGYYEASDLAAAVFGGIGIEPGTGVTKHIKMSRRLYGQLGDPVHHRARMVDALGV